MKITSFLGFEKQTSCEIPLVDSRVKAGFPSPAEDYVDRKIDLNKELVQHPSATFFVRVSGDSMVGAGILSGDMLMVDRALKVKSGNIVVAMVNGEFTVKKFVHKKGAIFLEAANPEYETISVEDDCDFEVWGVVTNVIRSLYS